MMREEIIERLKGYEWSDVEFKEARTAAPKAAYETVSAFANTAGGWLVFGVRDHGGAFEVVGVVEVDKVQGEFLSTLRSGSKVSRTVSVTEDLVETDGKTLLVFHVPESPRHEKPVYLDGDLRRSFIRRGGCDERCTPEEIGRFLRDAARDRYDDQPLDGLDAGEFFDPDSVRWYRYGIAEHLAGRLDIRAPGRSSGGQVGGDSEESVTDQGSGGTGDMVTDQVGSGSGDRVTDQVGSGAGGMVTDQVEPEAGGMSTAHVARGSGHMSTAHAHVAPGSGDMSTAHGRGASDARRDEPLTEPSARRGRDREDERRGPA